MYLKEIIQAGYRNGLTETQIKDILRFAVKMSDEERKKIINELDKENEKAKKNLSSIQKRKAKGDVIEDDERF